MAQINIPPANYSPVIPVEVKKELQVYEIKKQTGKPFFLATLFIPEMLWTTRIYDLDMILDKYVTMEAGNTTRVFLFSQCWHPEYCKWNLEPFVRDDEGKFIMPDPDEADEKIGKYINANWETAVLSRIQKVVYRKIMLIISLIDGCAFHYRNNCSWAKNFLNPDNNNIETSSAANAYEAYIEWSLGSPRAENTGKIVEAMTRYMLNRIYDSLSPRERKYISIETCNEGYSGTAWHMRMKEIIDETWGRDCPRWRRFTSTEAEISPRTRQHFTPVIHQVGDLKSYNKKTLLMPYFSGISTDGWRVNGQYAPVPIPLATAKALLKQAHIDGLVLMEMLNGHRQNDIRLPDGIHNTMPDRYYYDFSAMRWRDMQGLGRLLMRLTK